MSSSVRGATLLVIAIVLAGASLLPSGPAAGADCVTAPSGLVAWWPGEGNANDAVGSHNGALANGATYGAGEVGQAFQFDGANAVVVVPDDPVWNLAGDFTIDAWVNIHIVAGTNVLLGHDEGPGTVPKWIFWVNGSNLQMHLNGPVIGAIYIGVPFTPIADQWYHVAVTRTGSTYRFYVNGSQTGGDQTNTTVIPSATAPLTLGKAEALASLNGRLDEVDIFNVALTAGDIAGIFAAGAAGKCAVTPVSLQQFRAD